MRISSHLIRGAVLSAAVALVPSVAKASPGDQYLRFWTLCFAGTFNSCHSLQLQTTELLTGTAVVVRVRNLQGQDPNFIDNSPWSGLSALRFYGTGMTVNAGDASPTQAGTSLTTVGGATTGGATAWNRNMDATGAIGVLRMNGLSSPDGTNRRIGGCMAGAGATAPVMFTCGGQIVMSFATSTVFNAAQMTQAYARVDIGTGPSTSQNKACQTDNSAYTGSVGSTCIFGGVGGGLQATAVNYLGNNSVPEPMTVALLGSGLVGVIGARRRKKTSTEE